VGKAAQYLADIGDYYHNRKQADSAFHYYNKALAYLKDNPNDRVSGNISYMAGIVALRYSNEKQAVGYFEQAIAFKTRTGERRSLPDLYLQTGTSYRALGQLPKAMKLLEQAVEVAKEFDNKIVLTDGYQALAEMAEASGQKDKAIAYTKLLYENQKNENVAAMEHTIEEKDKTLQDLQKRKNESDKQYNERIERLQKSTGAFYEAAKRLEKEREILHEEVDSLNRVKSEQEFRISKQLEKMEAQGQLINAHERAIFYQRIVIAAAVVAILAIGFMAIAIYRNYVHRT
jgi:tetratricopeptide (TPR) repeat protein